MHDRLANIVSVKPLPGFRLWCKFDDGESGVRDFYDLAERPFCAKWRTQPGFFESVVVDGGALRWDDMIDACADAVRMDIFGNHDMLPRLPYPDIAEAVPGEGFSLACRFADGVRGVADFSDWVANDRFLRWRTEEAYFGKAEAVGWGVRWDAYTDISSACVYERACGGLDRA